MAERSSLSVARADRSTWFAHTEIVRTVGAATVVVHTCIRAHHVLTCVMCAVGLHGLLLAPKYWSAATYKVDIDGRLKEHVHHFHTEICDTHQLLREGGCVYYGRVEGHPDWKRENSAYPLVHTRLPITDYMSIQLASDINSATTSQPDRVRYVNIDTCTYPNLLCILLTLLLGGKNFQQKGHHVRDSWERL